MKNKNKHLFYYNSKFLQVAASKLNQSLITYKDITILPANIVVTSEKLQEYLHPEELVSSNDEFLRSRYLFRLLWNKRTFPWALVKQSRNRPYPKWPQGLCGSLTHKRGHVGVCLKKDFLSVGVDLEFAKIAEKVGRFIATKEEQKILEVDKNYWGLGFSIKESAFKCFYPLQSPLYLRDIKICQIDFDKQTFECQIAQTKNAAQGYYTWLHLDGLSYVLTYCEIVSKS
jgi:4'-phosphopantetheinyl transferase EntD